MRKRKILKGFYWILGYAFGMFLGTEKTWAWILVAGVTMIVMLIDSEGEND